MDIAASATYPSPMAATYPSLMPTPVPYGVEIANRVFVGGCPYNMTEMEMTEFFSKFGEVKDAKIITDRDGGKSRGYGFVTFASEEQAANVYSKGSIYYEQKKLNVAKAIRKHGGQYQKANQEYVNGQQRLVWLHPNGYLMAQQEGGWCMEQLPSHSQPVKPCYPLPQPTSGGFCYPPMNPAPYMPAPQFGHTPMYGSNFYGYGAPYATSSYMEDDTISIISSASLDSSSHYATHPPTYDNTSTDSTSHYAPPPPAGQEGEGNGEYVIDMKALEAKTKHLSLDSAYTSEADLDSSHNTTATNSGTTSPKEPCAEIEGQENSVPSSPKHRLRGGEIDSVFTVGTVLPPPT